MTADPDLLDFLSQHAEKSRRRRERGRRARRAIWPLLGVVALLALVGANVVVFAKLLHASSAGGTPAARTSTSRTAPPASHRHHATPARTHPATAARTHPVAPATASRAPKLITVRLTAARNASWVEIRADSATGRVLYDGIVSQGNSVHLRGRRFWARFGAIGNFDLSIDGRAVHPALNGTIDTIITAAAVRLASASATP